MTAPATRQSSRPIIGVRRGLPMMQIHSCEASTVRGQARIRAQGSFPRCTPSGLGACANALRGL